MNVELFDHIVFWPIELRNGRKSDGDMDAWVNVFTRGGMNGRSWRELDAYGENVCKEQRLAEFVYFHGFVRNILYANGKNRPLRVLQLDGIDAVEVTLHGQPQPIELDIRRIHLYLFDTNIGVLTIDLWRNRSWEIQAVQNFLDCFRRVYRPYYDQHGGEQNGGHVPDKVRWLSRPNNETVGLESDYPDAAKHTERVLKGEPPVSAHWECILHPLVPWLAAETRPAWRQLGDERLPAMTYLTVAKPEKLEDGDWIRLTFMDDGGLPGTLPYSRPFMKGFGGFCYDRFWDPDSNGHEWMRTRFCTCGYHLLVVGQNAADFVTNPETGLLFHFRRQYFQLCLFTHMQHGSLLVFLDRLYRAVQDEKGRKLHAAVQEIQRDFVRFTAGLWFTEVTSHLQGKELYELLGKGMGLQKLSDEVRAELQMAHESLTGMESLELGRAASFFAPLVLTIGFFGMNILTTAAPWFPNPVTHGWLLYSGAQVGVFLAMWASAHFLQSLILRLWQK